MSRPLTPSFSLFMLPEAHHGPQLTRQHKELRNQRHEELVTWRPSSTPVALYRIWSSWPICMTTIYRFTIHVAQSSLTLKVEQKFSVLFRYPNWIFSVVSFLFGTQTGSKHFASKYAETKRTWKALPVTGLLSSILQLEDENHGDRTKHEFASVLFFHIWQSVSQMCICAHSPKQF